jgi:hypothetical protein
METLPSYPISGPVATTVMYAVCLVGFCLGLPRRRARLLFSARTLLGGLLVASLAATAYATLDQLATRLVWRHVEVLDADDILLPFRAFLHTVGILSVALYALAVSWPATLALVPVPSATGGVDGAETMMRVAGHGNPHGCPPEPTEAPSA